MKRIRETYDNEQAWREARQTRLHTTDLAAILGVCPWKTALEIQWEKQGKLDPFAGNAATEIGHVVEPGLLDYAEQRLGPMERQAVWHAPEACLAATLDGWVPSTGENVEAKTAGLLSDFIDVSDWGEDGTDAIPPNYLLQTQGGMLCSGAEVCHVYALIQDRGVCYFRVKADEALQQFLASTCAQWWQRHMVDGDPVPEGRLPSIEVIKRLRRDPDSVRNLSDEDADVVQQWQDAKATAKAADKAAKELQAKVLMTLGEAEGGLLPSGQMVTYLETHRKGYEVGPKTFRTLRVRKK